MTELTCQVWYPVGTVLCPSMLAPQQDTFLSPEAAELMLHVCWPPATTACKHYQQRMCAVTSHMNLKNSDMLIDAAALPPM